MSDALFWHLSDVFALSDWNVSNGYGCTKSRRRQGAVFGYPPLTSVGRDLKTFTLMDLVVECFPFCYNSLLISFMSFAKCHPPPPPLSEGILAWLCFDSQLYLSPVIPSQAFLHCQSLTLTINSTTRHQSTFGLLLFSLTWNVLRTQLSFNKYWTNEHMNAFSPLPCSVPLQPWFWASPYKHRISQQQQCQYWGPGHWGVGCFVHS